MLTTTTMLYSTDTSSSSENVCSSAVCVTCSLLSSLSLVLSVCRRLRAGCCCCCLWWWHRNHVLILWWQQHLHTSNHSGLLHNNVSREPVTRTSTHFCTAIFYQLSVMQQTYNWASGQQNDFTSPNNLLFGSSLICSRHRNVSKMCWLNKTWVHSVF